MKAPTIKWEDIGPKKAIEYLKKSVANRGLREPTVKAFVSDMRNGDWIPETNKRTIRRLASVPPPYDAVNQLLRGSDMSQRAHRKAGTR